MTADQHITQAAAYAAVAYRNGDDTLGDYWSERVTRLSDQRELLARQAELTDTLRGTVDHG